MKTGVELIAEERRRQVEELGWTPEHDEHHTPDTLLDAGICYAMYESINADPEYAQKHPADLWPWDKEWWKPEDRLRNLVRAGALIAAQIDLDLRREGQDG